MAPLQGPSFQRWVLCRRTSSAGAAMITVTTTTTPTTAAAMRTRTMTNRPAVIVLVAAVIWCALVGQIPAVRGESEDLSGTTFFGGVDAKVSFMSLLERAKRDNSDQETQLSLHQRSAREAAGQSAYEKQLSRQNRMDLTFEQDELSRQKRSEKETDVVETAPSREERADPEIELSREKRVWVSDDNKLSKHKRHEHEIEAELSRQKRFDTDVKEQELSRQKRFDSDVEEQDLSRQKRFDSDVTEQELSRQKRFDSDVEEHELSRQKRFDSNVIEQELSRQKRVDGDVEEQELSRQKRVDGDVEEQELSRQKRFDSDVIEQELSRQKRFDSDAEELELSRQKRLETEVGEQELFRQKRFDDENDDERLSRQKRDEMIILTRKTRFLQQAKEPAPDSNYGTYNSPAQRTRELLEKSPALKFAKEPPAKRTSNNGPEHRNYHDDLLARRMDILKTASKRSNKKEINPEDEDDWEHELRIRRELAERAEKLGIQRMKERKANPELYNHEMSVLQRIRKDAQEILARRAEEAKLGIKPVAQNPAASLLGEDALDETEEEEGEDGAGEAVFNTAIFPPLDDSVRPMVINSKEDLVNRIRKSLSKGNKKRKKRRKRRSRN